MDAPVQDKSGNSIAIGNVIRVTQLPDVKLDETQYKEANSMIGECFVVEAIEHDRAEVTKWFYNDQDEWCHTLFLHGNEFELTNKPKINQNNPTQG